MSTYKARKNAARRFSVSTSKLLASTALVAAVILPDVAQAGTVEANETWQFEAGTDVNATTTSLGHVHFDHTGSNRIIGNLVKEDICATCSVDINSALTVATGVESGPMQLLGRLTSNGEVKILDVNGFLFGKNSVVDTQGFAAIVGLLKNADSVLTDGKLDIDVAEDASITIEEGAMISVGEAGLAAFVAPFISNSGVINAKMGTVALAAGETVTLDLYGDGLVEVAVDGELAEALIENKGTIEAEGGRVQMTALAAKDAVDNVINTSGIVTVASAEVVGGKIVLSGGNSGKVSVSGKVDASGTQGGDIDINGENIDVTETGDLLANATEGKAGNVNSIAKGKNEFHGAIEATGQNGQGGFVELSGDQVVIDGTVKLGEGGELLIDPTDLCVFGTGGICGAIASTVDFIATIRPVLLGGSDVTTMTSAAGGADGDITVVGDLSDGGFATASRVAWNVIAHDDVIFGDNIFAGDTGVNQAANLVVTGAGLDVNFESLGTGLGGLPYSYTAIVEGSTLRTGGGDVTFKGGNFLHEADTTVDAGAGSVTFTGLADNDMSVGDDNGGAHIDQSELDTIFASEIIFGLADGGTDNNIFIDNVDLTHINQTTVNTEEPAGPYDVTFGGINEFKGLNVNAEDDIIFEAGASVETHGDAVFNADSDFGGAGDFIMNAGSSIDTNSYNITITAGDFGGTNATHSVFLDTGASIDAEGGNILIDQGGRYFDEGSFFSVDADTLRTSGAGTITVNQHDESTIQNAVDAFANTGSGLNTLNVGEGTYNEDVTLTQDNFLLNGNVGDPNVPGAGSPLLQGDGDGIGVTVAGLSNVTIQGLHIDNYDYGILADIGFGGVIPNTIININNNTISNTNYYAAFIDEFAHVDFTFNDINVTSGNGVHVEDFNNTTANITDNLINSTAGTGIGIDVFDIISSGIWPDDNMTANILRNTVDGFATGVSVDGAENTTLADNTISNNTTGVLVTNLQGASGVAIGTGNVITGGTDGMVFNGASVDILGDTLSNTVFGGQSGKFVRLINDAEFLPGSPTVIDATGVTWGTYGILPTGTDAIAVENMIDHFADTGTDGLINFGSIVVNNNVGEETYDGSIQLGVNAAGNANIGNLIIAGSGANYGGSVEVWVDGLKIEGVNYNANDVTIDVATADAYANNGDVDNGFVITDLGTVGDGSDVTGVNIDPITFTGAGDGIVLGTGESAAIDTTIDGNIFTNTGVGVKLDNVGGTTSIVNNDINTGSVAIQVNENLNGDTVLIDGNTQIRGAGDAIAFAQGVKNATVSIVNNDKIEGRNDDGIDFVKAVTGGSAVEISNNHNIIGGSSNGIEFHRVNGGSTVDITGNNAGIFADDSGIFFNTVNGGAVLNIHDNIIQTNLDQGTFGSGIYFHGDVTDATVNIGDGTLYGAPSNIISALENTVSADQSNIDGILFAAGVGTGAKILIDGNRIGYTAASLAGPLTGAPIADDGIEFRGVVGGNADIQITDNRIKAADDGVKFNGKITDDARILIGGHYDGNAIFVGGDGVQFGNDIEKHSLVEISYNEIDADENGIEFNGETSNHIHAGHDEEILIKKNTIEGGEHGIIFYGKASNWQHDIVIRDNYKIAGYGENGVTHIGSIDDAELLIKNNDEIFGREDGVKVAGYFYNDAKIHIHGNSNVRGEYDDGIHVEDYGYDTGADVDVDYNHVHWSDDEGIFVKNIENAQIHDNTVHDVNGNGIYGSNIDGGDILNNTIYNVGENGILVNPTDYIDIAYNTIHDVDGDGIRVEDGKYADIWENHIGRTGDDGIHVQNNWAVEIWDNYIHNTGEDSDHGDGIYIRESDDAKIKKNRITGAGHDGINVYDTEKANIKFNEIDNTGEHGIYANKADKVDIIGNMVYKAGWDGIKLKDSKYGDILFNKITKSTGDGIDAENVYKTDIGFNTVKYNNDNGIEVTDSKFIDIHGNFAAGNTAAGIFVDPSWFINVAGNVVTNNLFGIHFDEVYFGDIGHNIIKDNFIGVKIEGSHFIDVNKNHIANNYVGLWAYGGDNGYINVRNNVFLNNPYHAKFNSGIIDLTHLDEDADYSNEFYGGKVALYFDAWNNKPWLLSLVKTGGIANGWTYDYLWPFLNAWNFYGNDSYTFDTFNGTTVFPPTEFGGTIGAQLFDGQSDYFVKLGSKTFVVPGDAPEIEEGPVEVLQLTRLVKDDYYFEYPESWKAIWLDAQDSTYVMDGVPFRPSDTGGAITEEQFSFLADKFFHWPQINDRGIFFFGFVPDDENQTIENVEDFFNNFGPYGPGLRGLNLTLTGLPPVNGTTGVAGIETAAGEDEDLTDIEPAAGEDDLANIEPAAGGEDAACWGDVLNAAINGVVNYYFTSDPSEMLSDAVNCGSQNL